MASHNDRGKHGEEVAAKWLKERGFELLHRNWRHSHYEIDIVAAKGKFLHFIEVKTLNSNFFGHPEGQCYQSKI